MLRPSPKTSLETEKDLEASSRKFPFYSRRYFDARKAGLIFFYSVKFFVISISGDVHALRCSECNGERGGDFSIMALMTAGEDDNRT